MMLNKMLRHTFSLLDKTGLYKKLKAVISLLVKVVAGGLNSFNEFSDTSRLYRETAA